MAIFRRNMTNLWIHSKLKINSTNCQLIRNHVSQESIQIKSSPNVFFKKYLFLTNTISSGIMMFGGDLIQQEIEYRMGKLPERYDWERLRKMSTVGIGVGLWHHWYYIYLDRLLPGSTLRIVGLKIIADQTLASALCISSFFYLSGLLEKKSLTECTSELKEKWWTVYIADWMVWPLAQFFNFYYIKPEYRVLYINVITTFYDVFLSFIKHADQSIDAVEKNV